MTQKYSMTFSVGMIIGMIMIIVATIRVGPIPLILYCVFIILAYQDKISGRVNIVSFVPYITIPIFYMDAFLKLFMPTFTVLFIVWVTIYTMIERRLKKTFFGFGDVLGLPIAVTVSWILAQVIGIVVFVLSLLLMMPWFMKKKERRFLPWLLPGLTVNFLIAVLLI